MPTTTINTLPNPVQQALDLRMLAIERPDYIHGIPADRRIMERNRGNTDRLRRYQRLPAALTPLSVDGTEPAATPLNAVDIDVRIQLYGQFIRMNEQITLTTEDPVLNEAATVLGLALRETEDVLVRNMLQATAAMINAAGGGNGDVPTEPTRADIDQITKLLRGNNAIYLLDGIEGEDKFGAAPVRASYMALGHTNAIGTLDQIPGFLSISQYPAQNSVHMSEWGTVGNLRFYLSTLGAIEQNASALGRDVLDFFCVGMESYGIIEQDGLNAHFIYRPPMYSDALAQNFTVGWKMAMGTGLFNDSWVLKFRFTLA